MATIPDTHVRHVSTGAAGYRISITLPAGPPPIGGFPVMYLLDANAGFATVVETHRRLSRRPDATSVGPAVIVGIGHASDELYDTASRHRDYAPPRLGNGGADSGAEVFLDFVETRLKPEVEAMFPIDPRRQILVGHSLSGYFALWVMTRHTQAFQSYVAISPSLWVDALLKSEIPTITREISRVFIAAGEWEQALAPWQADQANAKEIALRRSQRRMVSNAREYAAALGEHIGSERVQFELFPDEDHASVFGIAISRAFRSVLAPAPA